MDKLTLENTRDFPMTTNTLAFMQAAYKVFEQLGYLGGDNIIISGCEITGSSAAPGYMFLNGQLMPFLGGVIQSDVRIVTVTTSISVDAGVRQQISYRAEFGTSTNPAENVAWTEITKIKSLSNLMTRLDSSEINIDDHDTRLDGLEYETNWHEAPLLEGGDDLSTELLAIKRKGNVVHYRIGFRFNKENPTTYPKWQLPDWAIATDQMYSSGRQHQCICLYDKLGSTNINSLPVSFYSEDYEHSPKQAVVMRGYAEGTLFGHSYTGNDFQAEGTFIV